MNKKTLAAITFFSAVILMAQSATAQNGSVKAGLISFPVIQEGLITNATVPTRVSARALRHFNKSFAGRQPAWVDTDNVLQAKFNDESMRTVVGYAKNGRWLYTINHYAEKQMPAELRHLVKSEYYDYKIDLINEVRSPKIRTKVYLVHLQNDNRQHKILRFSEEGLELVKSYDER